MHTEYTLTVGKCRVKAPTSLGQAAGGIPDRRRNNVGHSTLLPKCAPLADDDGASLVVALPIQDWTWAVDSAAVQ